MTYFRKPSPLQRYLNKMPNTHQKYPLRRICLKYKLTSSYDNKIPYQRIIYTRNISPVATMIRSEQTDRSPDPRKPLNWNPKKVHIAALSKKVKNSWNIQRPHSSTFRRTWSQNRRKKISFYFALNDNQPNNSYLKTTLQNAPRCYKNQALETGETQ